MSENGYKECPYCGEEVKTQAIKCKHCHSMLDNENKIEIQETRTPVAATHKRSNAWLKPVLIIVCIFAVVMLIVLMLSGMPDSEDTATMSEEEYVEEMGKYIEEFMVSIMTLSYCMPTNTTIAEEVVTKVERPANKIIALNAPKTFKSGHEDIVKVMGIAKDFCSLHLRAVNEMDATLYEDFDADKTGYDMGVFTSSGITKMAASVEKDKPELADKLNRLLDKLNEIANKNPKNLTFTDWAESTAWVIDLSNKTTNIKLLPTEGATKEEIVAFRATLNEVRYLTPTIAIARYYYNDYLPGILEFEKYADAMEEENYFLAVLHLGNAVGVSSDKGVLDAVILMFDHLSEYNPN